MLTIDSKVQKASNPNLNFIGIIAGTGYSSINTEVLKSMEEQYRILTIIMPDDEETTWGDYSEVADKLI